MSETRSKSTAETEPDPLASLHKMSTTAGLGSGDYVAINPVAIFAIIMGVASALALFEETILLILPAAALIGAIIALRQISKSSGTQTGRGLAIAAILLALLFGGYTTVKASTESLRTREDRVEIGGLIHKLGENVRSGDFNAAYAMFIPRFQERTPIGKFTDTMKQIQKSAVYGSLKGIDWNERAVFEVDETTQARQAAAALMLTFENDPDPKRLNATFAQVNGKWMISDIPDMFKAEEKPGGR